MFGIKKRRRARLMRQPFPAEWLAIIGKMVPYYALLPPADQEELRGLVQVFLAEKHFEGCEGVEITDEIRVTIAAQACILLLHRETDIYPLLESILVYPTAYWAPVRRREPGGFISEDVEDRSGESWSIGALVLSWNDVVLDARDIHDGFNVVLHEFAHQLDDESGRADGAPLLPERSMYADWERVFGEEYDRLVENVERRRPTFLDPYAATDPAEFFAVATEYFFEKAGELKLFHPELYEQLRLYYRQDPASFAGA
jgi:Mlc titration factor MtfA (ptsG expression regulator)